MKYLLSLVGGYPLSNDAQILTLDDKLYTKTYNAL